MIFNQDMDQRLADLQACVEAGEEFSAAFHGEFNGLPNRLVLDLPRRRRFALDIPMALGLAEQLSANGHEDASAILRAVIV